MKLGHYEIGAALGAGGMGEVFRATDTKLGRAVALKVLPAAMAQDPEENKIKKVSKSPFMSKAIYQNYAKGMGEKNKERAKRGLVAIYIRTYEEWSNG